MRLRLSSMAILCALAACGGGGSAANSEPAVSSVTQKSEVWTHDSTAALGPSQPWEYSPISKSGFVGEPSVIQRADGSYAMWYTGGWELAATGVATSLDGVNWTKNPSNPIIGGGKLGVAISARNSVIQHDGQVYIYFADSIGDRPGSIWVTHSADGITNLSTPALLISPGSVDINLANSWSVRDGDGWRVFYDSVTPPGTVWETFSAYCTTPLGPCTKDPGPLKGLQAGVGSYGAGWVRKVGSRFDTYYLAGPSGMLPTDIYHACDAGTGKVAMGNGGKPVVTIPAGMDQVGDPFVLDGPTSRMWWTDADNRTGYAVISTATYPGGLASIDCPMN